MTDVERKMTTDECAAGDSVESGKVLVSMN